MSAPGDSRVTINDFSLQSFAVCQLARGNEWTDYVRVQGARPPRSRTTIQDEGLVTKVEDPSPDFAMKVWLHDQFVARLNVELQSGDWEVLALNPGASSRSPVEIDLVLRIRDVSFLDNRLGRFTMVQIRPASSDDRYLRTKQFIETVCKVIPAKKGVTKAHVQDLADQLLPFSVRDDHFKIAWDNAEKPIAWTKPGP